MDEDAELEEGEAKEACDPDTDFSYIDKKLDRLLGDCQKEFQGGNLSTEKLGSKYGGYGTFLPTHARTPSLLANPHPPPHGVEPARVAAEEFVEPLRRASSGTADRAPQGEATNPPMTSRENGVTSSSHATKKVKIKIKMGKTAADEAQLKAIYNGLCLPDSSSSSLGDDETFSHSNAESSPEPSPMSMIQIMTSYSPRLLSPLPETVDHKENPVTLKPRNRTVASSNARSYSGKVDLNSTIGHSVEEGKDKGNGKEKQILSEMKKFTELVADGGKRSRRDSDVAKKGAKEPAGKGPGRAARNEISREQLEVASEKVGEGPGKEDTDSGKELLLKSSRKPPESKGAPGGNVNKHKESREVGETRTRKPSSLKDRERKETPRSKEATKNQARKEGEAAKLLSADRDSVLGSGTESRKQVKEENKEATAFKAKDNLKEGKKDNQKKEVAGDSKVRELKTESSKPAGKSGSATKQTPNSATGRKVEQKGSKSVRDTKLPQKEREKEREKERVSAPEAIPRPEEVPPATRVEPAPASVLVPQLVLDNWVECDKCDKWRLLLPDIDPDTLPKKWRCKMMSWLPGMNKCSLPEAETTAAVYAALGYQNPALAPAPVSAADTPSLPPPPPPVVEPAEEKWADQSDTKKTTLMSKTKKGVARKYGTAGVKAGGSNLADGSVKSKSLNDVGLDSNAEGAAVVSDKNKNKAKDKNKRPRASEGEDIRLKKKVQREEERNTDPSQREKEFMDIEPIQVSKERDETLHLEGEARGASTVPAKRKKLGTFDNADETKPAKKTKAGHAKTQVNDMRAANDEECNEGGKWQGTQRGKSALGSLKTKDLHHSSLADIDTKNITAVVKDIRDSFEHHESGDEIGREEVESLGRIAADRRLREVFEKQRKLKEDESESEERGGKRRKKEAELDLKRHPDRPISAGPPMYRKEGWNQSTSSKVVTSSLESSGTRSKARASPIESTVSSSPVRLTKGDRDLPITGRDGLENPTLRTDNAPLQRSCSESPKHKGDTSRRSSWDEGEYRHAGSRKTFERPRKYESNHAPQDMDWYYEDRGGDPGYSCDHHGDRRVERNRDLDKRDNHYGRRGNDSFDQDSDRGRHESRGEQEDRYSRERSTRDDRGRPSSRESRLDKPGGRPWRNDRQPDGVEDIPSKDETLHVEHGGRESGSFRDGDRGPLSRKESEAAAVGTHDTVGAIKRPVAPSNARVVGEAGEAVRREEFQAGPVKAGAREGSTGSPTKKEHAQAQHLGNVALKDATSLKHSADRLKGIPGNEGESTNLYLQAALKFLQAAAILEPINTEGARLGEITQSMKVYNDTAKLCEFCALTYIKGGDLRAAALAYTCAAVARVRVMLSKQACFTRDRTEFQAATQISLGPHVASNGPLPPPPFPSAEKPGPSLAMVPVSDTGESPSSSSASDVDNLNNHALVPVNKSALLPMGKPGMASTQIIPGAPAATSQIISVRLRPVVSRVLRDANEMSALLDSWVKASEATAKAEASEEKEGMAAVKQVGELGGFGDIDAVVRLMRVAMDAIGH